MFRFRVAKRAIVAVVSAVLVSVLIAASQQADMLWHHRNLGKAFYENPTTAKEAVEQFRQALDMAPDSVRERINYRTGAAEERRHEGGCRRTEKAQKQDPSIPHTWFNLGIVAKRDGDYARAISELSECVKMVPARLPGTTTWGRCTR